MEKRRLHHYWTKMRMVPYWWLLAASLVLLVTSVFALRANNQRMIGLRQAVFTADEQDGDVEAALKQLREYVYAHMNTDLTSGNNAIHPPIQLKYRYERLVLAESAKLSSANETIYTDAQNHCEQAVPTGHSGRNRLDCIREYVDSHGVQTESVSIPDALYKFDFVSPVWSPDLAGITLAAGFLCLLAFFLLLLSELFIKRELSKHH